MKMKFTCLTLFTLLIIQVKGQNVGDYQSAASGDWTNAPAARWDVWDGDSWEDAVTAPNSSSGVITILSGHNITVGLLAVTADQVVVAPGGILTVNTALTVDDGAGIDLEVDGTLTLNGPLNTGTGSPMAQIDGTMDWTGGTLSLPSTVSAAGVLNISGANKTLSSTLTNDGTINWSASQITFSNGTLDNNAAFNATGATPFNNAAATVNVFNNNVTGVFTKSVNAGNVTFNIPVTNAGTININTGAVVSTSVNGSFTNSGTINFNSTALTIGGTLAGGSAFNAGTNFTGTGTLTITGGTAIGFALNLPASVALTFSTGTLSGAGSLEINGTMTWTTGVLSVATTIAPAGTLNLNTSTRSLTATTLTNNGNINWNGGDLNFNNATLTNNATITATGNNSFANTSGTNLFDNAGVFTKNTGVTNTTLAVPVTNSGTININSGTVVKSVTAMTNTGTIALASTTFSHTGGALTLDPGTDFTGTGTFSSSQATTINLPLILSSTITYTLNVGSTINLASTGSVTINGTFNWNTAGGLNVPFTIASGAVANAAGGNAKVAAAAVTNNGTLNLGAITALQIGSVNFPTQTLTNNGTINESFAVATVQVSSGGGLGVKTFLNNSSGVINKTSTNTFSFTTVTVSNAGVLKGTGTYLFTTITPNTGSIQPGNSPGILSTSPNALGANTPTVQIEVIDGSGDGTGHDRLDMTGVTTLTNTALVVTENPGAPSQTYTIMTAPAVNGFVGTFASTNLPAGYTVNIDNSVNPSVVTLTKSGVVGPPVFSNVPPDVTVQCNAIPAPGSPTATNGCEGGVTVVYNGETITEGACADSYTITRTWTATDNCGNSSMATQTITVIDDTKPVFTFVPANVSVQCDAIPAVGTPTATDNCDANVTITYQGQTTEAGSCADSYVITRTWTVTDNCGNTETATQTITVSDNTAPVFSFVPANTTVQCDAVPAAGTATATDNCDADVAIVYNGETITAGSCADSYTITRTWTATDNCGNSATGTQVITVVDNTAPVFSFVPANSNIQCNTALPAVGTPTATDNCDSDVTIVYDGETTTPGDCADSYTVTRTWTATDNCGNSTVATQVITVVDETAPTFTFVPASTSAECNSIPAVGSPTATDNCDNDVTIVYNGETTMPGNTSDSYVITRTWTATDNCGNSETASQTITVSDGTAPAFTFVPANTSVQCSAIPEVGTPAANDNCDADVTIVYDGETITAGDCADSYTLTRTWTATDNAGNSTTATQVITVVDNEAPVFSFVPANGAAECSSVPAVETPVATDNCDGDVAITYNGETITPGTCADSYTITRSWTATDNCGNSTNATQTISVTDNTQPVFGNIPANATIQCSALVPEVGSPTATDNCDADVVIVYNGESTTPGNCADSYTITRSWTATDNCGNSTTLTQTINVVDNTDPVFSFVPASTTVQCGTIPEVGSATATDNCDNDVTIVYNGETMTPGNCADSYTLTRSWTATDNCGNSATGTQIITVVDNTAPTFTFVPASATADCNSIPAVGTPAATDNCDGDVAIVYNGETTTPGNTNDSYIITRTWTATDNCGNSETTTQTITVTDGTAPQFTFVPANTTVQCNAIPAVGAPTASDNCDADVTIVYNGQTSAAGDCADSYTLTRTWTATDNAGHSTVTTQTITVVDNTAPTFTFVPANTAAQCNAVPAVGTPTASDNCDPSVSIVYNGETSTPGNCAGSYTLTRTWTATDNCGNITTATQTISVVDNTPPAISCPSNAVRSNNGALCTYTAVGNEFNATATDNCSAATLSYALTGATTGTGSTLSGVEFNKGVTTVTWTATDGCGNQSVCSFTVTVNDAVAPSITCPADISENANCVALEINVPNPVIDDNCGVTTLTWVLTGATTGSSPAAGVNYVGSRNFNPGVTTVTYTVKDEANNSTSCSFTVTVTGVSLPSIVCPPDITIEAFPLLCYGILWDLGEPNTSGGCGGGTVTVSNNQSSIFFPVGTTEIIWTAKDKNGNTATCVQKVTVVDTQDPLLICPLNKTVNADPGQCYATNPNIGSPILAWDNCGVESITNNAPAQFPAGTTVVTWTVKDVNGNTSTCTQSVTVVDGTGPEVNCPANIVQSTSGSSCSKSIATANPAAFDNCSSVTRLTWTLSGATTASSPSSGINYVGTRTFNAGVTTVTYTARDASGNTSSCSFTVTLTETTAPSITCPSNITSNAQGNTCAKTINVPKPSVSDNCGVTTLTWVMTGATTGSSPATGINYVGNRSFNIGTTTVTYTAKDGSGNARSCSFTVKVTENQKPKISCPSNINQAIGNNCSKSISTQNPSFSDNCGVVALTWVMTGATTGSSASSGINYVGTRTFNIGTTKVTYTAADASGNIRTCSFNVKLTGNCSRRVSAEYTQVKPDNDQTDVRAGLNANAFPNPSEAGFNLVVRASDTRTTIQVKVYDMVGRIVYQAKGIPGQSFRFGEKFVAGSYMVEVTQGGERTTIKLVKQ